MGDTLGTGTKALDSEPVQGTWRMLHTPDDVLELMDTSAEGVVAGVADAGRHVPRADLRRADRGGLPLGHAGEPHRDRQPRVPGALHHGDRLPGRGAGRRHRGRGRLLGRHRDRPSGSDDARPVDGRGQRDAAVPRQHLGEDDGRAHRARVRAHPRHRVHPDLGHRVLPPLPGADGRDRRGQVAGGARGRRSAARATRSTRCTSGRSPTSRWSAARSSPRSG